MTLIHRHIEREVYAEFLVNGFSVPMVEGFKHRDEVWIQWKGQDGRMWEGLVTDLQKQIPKESTVGPVKMHFTVAEPRPLQKLTILH